MLATPQSSPLYPRQLNEKLTLKRLQPDNANAFLAFVKNNRSYLEQFDPFVSEFHTLASAQELLTEIADLYDQNRSLSCGIWDGSEFIGYIICRLELESKSIQLGYGLAKKYQGHGIITAAARIVLNYAFENRAMKYAWLTCWTNNLRSLKLAERLGFIRTKEIIPADPSKNLMHEQYRYILQP